MLDQDKIQRCMNLLRENYIQNSIVTDTVEIVNYNEDQHRGLDFLKFGIWTYVPREWFSEPNIVPDLVFEDFGRSIAFGEENYLIKQILENKEVERRPLAEVTYRNVVNALIEMGYRSNLVMFVPIDYFVKIHLDWVKEAGMPVVERNELIMGERRIRLFWSSKYIDFNDLIIVDRSFGRWISKPNVAERLTVNITESRERTDRMEVRAETVFHFDILEPSRLIILRPESRLG